MESIAISRARAVPIQPQLMQQSGSSNVPAGEAQAPEIPTKMGELLKSWTQLQAEDALVTPSKQVPLEMKPLEYERFAFKATYQMQEQLHAKVTELRDLFDASVDMGTSCEMCEDVEDEAMCDHNEEGCAKLYCDDGRPATMKMQLRILYKLSAIETMQRLLLGTGH